MIVEETQVSRLKFAVVGLGIGNKIWAKLITDSPEFALAGLVDIDPARLSEAGDQFAVQESARFTDYHQALKTLRERLKKLDRELAGVDS